MTKDKDGYPCEPRTIDDDTWYYEQKEGIIIVHVTGWEYPVTSTMIIPWGRLTRAVDRHREVNGPQTTPSPAADEPIIITAVLEHAQIGEVSQTTIRASAKLPGGTIINIE